MSLSIDKKLFTHWKKKFSRLLSTFVAFRNETIERILEPFKEAWLPPPAVRCPPALRRLWCKVRGIVRQSNCFLYFPLSYPPIN